ncbi:PadR family transcriptional regulator [Candidatus Dojkabacteria bacterium]|nr:PadR family transcriptional regulator [Candidatus Dojkabacteria bacterium]
MSSETQFKKGTLELCVLALINKKKRYGYDLVCSLRDSGLLVAEGTLYPILSRLGKEGLVEHSWVESNQGPPRKYYEITPSGRRLLEKEKKEWRKISKGVNKIVNS